MTRHMLLDDYLKNIIIVRSPEDFGTIDPTKEYFIDGIVDMGDTSIEVPAGGINITGYDFGISKILSSEDSYTMFTSPGGGSGDVLIKDVAFCVTGAGSQLFDLEAVDAFRAFEFARVNFEDCTSLGEITAYRQGLEDGSGRFGGTPTLTLSGAWAGGYRITTSIVRALDAGMTESLFKEGTAFTMQSRFLTDINCDLPASASFCDFQPSNFPNPSTLQIVGAIFTRNGSVNPNDANIFPNISQSDLPSNWKNNQGIRNTFVGGRNTITNDATTIITSSGVYVLLNATTWTTSNLEHFDSPSPGQLRNIGNNPLEFRFEADFTLDSGANNELGIRLIKYDDSEATTEVLLEQMRQVNSLIGGRDVAFFTLITTIELETNDYVYLEVANFSGTANITAEEDSFYIVEEK